MEIKNKQVVITGANRGIGKAVTERMAEEGAHLHLVVRQPAGLESWVQELHQKGAASVKLYAADLSQKESVQRLLFSLADLPVDILFNNAGLLTGGLLEKQPLQDIEQMLEVNINSLIRLTHFVLPGMLARKSGKIINHSSVSAIMHFPSSTTYAASKAAVLAFTNALEMELKGTGVSTLVLVTPGIKTDMFAQIKVLYGETWDVPTMSIEPAQYAQMICRAVHKDMTVLNPSGVTGLGLIVAKHAPSIFNWVAHWQFRRS